MWKELKPTTEQPVVKQHEAGGTLQDWWLVEVVKKNGRGSTSWGFPTKEAAENAIQLARGLVRAGVSLDIHYKIMQKHD